MLIIEALEEYYYYGKARNFTDKTMKNKNQEMRQLTKFLKDKRGITELESITKYDMKAYIRLKQDRKLQPQSIISMSKMVKAFFNWAISEEYITENPMDGVSLPKVPKKLLVGFTKKEVKSLINSFSGKSYLEIRNKAMIAILADCGLRSQEVRVLKNSSIKDNAILVQGKGNKDRMVFISPALKQILLKYEREKRKYFRNKYSEDYYFLSYQGKGLSHPGLDNLVKEAGRRAAVDNVHPHRFRHYYAVQAISGNNPIDVYSLSRLLGHSDIGTTQRYLQTLSTEELLKKALSVSPLSSFND